MTVDANGELTGHETLPVASFDLPRIYTVIAVIRSSLHTQLLSSKSRIHSQSYLIPKQKLSPSSLVW